MWETYKWLISDIQVDVCERLTDGCMWETYKWLISDIQVDVCGRLISGL